MILTLIAIVAIASPLGGVPRHPHPSSAIALWRDNAFVVWMKHPSPHSYAIRERVNMGVVNVFSYAIAVAIDANGITTGYRVGEYDVHNHRGNVCCVVPDSGMKLHTQR